MPFVLSSSSFLAAQCLVAQGFCLVAQEQVVDIQAASSIWSMAGLIESSLEYVLRSLDLAGHVVMLDVFPTKGEDIVPIRIEHSYKDTLGV
jgi:hypothetical protein